MTGDLDREVIIDNNFYLKQNIIQFNMSEQIDNFIP